MKMNALAVVFVALALAGANCQYLERSALFSGPSGRSTLVGVDGSHIFSEVEGGAVLPREIVAPVPEVVVARAEPLIVPAPEFVPLPVTPLVHPVPVFEHGRSDIIAGPSGTIVAHKDFDYTPLVAPIHREIYAEPAVRTIFPTHHGLIYGRSFAGDYYHGVGGLYERHGVHPILY